MAGPVCRGLVGIEARKVRVETSCHLEESLAAIAAFVDVIDEIGAILGIGPSSCFPLCNRDGPLLSGRPVEHKRLDWVLFIVSGKRGLGIVPVADVNRHPAS